MSGSAESGPVSRHMDEYGLPLDPWKGFCSFTRYVSRQAVLAPECIWVGLKPNHRLASRSMDRCISLQAPGWVGSLLDFGWERLEPVYRAIYGSPLGLRLATNLQGDEVVLGSPRWDHSWQAWHLGMPAFSKQPSLVSASTSISQAPTWIPKLSQRFFCLWMAAKLLLLREGMSGGPLTSYSTILLMISTYVLKLDLLHLMLYHLELNFCKMWA